MGDLEERRSITPQANDPVTYTFCTSYTTCSVYITTASKHVQAQSNALIGFPARETLAPTLSDDYLSPRFCGSILESV
jgi:hypothetical protein